MGWSRLDPEEEGIKKGREKGLQAGRQEGMREGIIELRNRQAKAIALIKRGCAREEIYKATGLDVEDDPALSVIFSARNERVRLGNDGVSGLKLD